MSKDPVEKCEHCERMPAFRRGLCRSCYRKFDECGLTMPARRKTWRKRRPPLHVQTSAPVLDGWLHRWLRRWDTAALARFERAVAEVRLERALEQTGAAP